MSQILLDPPYVCVYCASSGTVPKEVIETAREMAVLLAEHGLNLIYGGTTCGLMKVVADAHKEAGGKVTGIIPRFMSDYGIAYPNLDDKIIVETMAERKAQMIASAGAFVILPGGIGTMDEFFDTLAQKQLGFHDKPVILLNVLDFFQPVLDFFQLAVKMETIKPEHLRLFTVVQTAAEVIKVLAMPVERVKPKLTG